MAGPDSLAIINDDGSFANPTVEFYLTGLINALAGPGAAPAPLTSYVDQVAILPDYPATFPFAAHGHGIGSISGLSIIGQVLTVAATIVEAQAAVGLDLVDNTADVDKPLSALMIEALGLKASVTAVDSIVSHRTPTLYASSATTVPARATVVNAGYTGPVIIDISDYVRSGALDAAAVAVMLNGDRLIRRRS